MRQYLDELKNFLRKGDLILLLLCVATSAFGCLVITSSTNHYGTTRFLFVQIAAILIGVVVYALVSSVEISFLSENRRWLVVFNIVLLLLLLTPFGTDKNTGNRSWLMFPFLPVDIQPAEFCKISFVIILASVMASHQDRISSVSSVMHMVSHLLLVFVANMYISGDLGVSLIFVFVFAAMAWTGGVRVLWFLAGGGLVMAAAPVLWEYGMKEYQRRRIEVVFNPEIDPLGLDERYHTLRSQLSLFGGGLTGQGLFNGNRTQAGDLYAQHTDFIFSSIGEEMGYVGCLLVLAMLLSIVARCIYVGVKNPDFLRKMLCFGVAAALIFQIFINVGMCIGVVPVIGLTLPFISYGASSIVSLYAMLGLVSGVYARPAPTSHELYIRPPMR
jgi:rod shape determining protein RodA